MISMVLHIVVKRNLNGNRVAILNATMSTNRSYSEVFAALSAVGTADHVLATNRKQMATNYANWDGARRCAGAMGSWRCSFLSKKSI